MVNNDQLEKYKCPRCGTSFEITKKERMAQFILQRPHEWNCPKCSATCFELDQGFKGTGGGKF